MATKNYTNISDIKKMWLDTIAPNYFDFEDINNYNTGTFGYINEILANTTEDTFNAVTTARREFYPVTAKFQSSLYAMAALQSIPIPMTTPAVCKCALILEQQEVLDNSTFLDGIGTCVIDSTLKMFAGDLQFMIDYPIRILSKKTDKWQHTIYYDATVSNSLNLSTNTRYISNKVLRQNGTDYLILFLDIIRQLEMTEDSTLVIKDGILETYTTDVDFVGNIANFEVFYKESTNADEIQLEKILVNEVPPTTPYVQYEFITDNKIRLIFTYNSVFNPKYNSEIICRVYTSKGSDGNFISFLDDVQCISESDKYPYNANMTIIGKINGSAIAGADKPSIDGFRDTVVKAYTTNNTITTSKDLQIFFDDMTDDIPDVKVLFKKKRDDAFIRLFGAYTTMKDSGQNVIPTNTLDMEVLKSELVDDVTENINRVIIPPGIIFQYKDIGSFIVNPLKEPDGSLMKINKIEELQEANPDELYFTNPFLIGIGLNPNNVGYYLNSIDKTISIEYTYVNDDSSQQFIGGSTYIYRNAISGSNYYKLRIRLSPATEVDMDQLISIPDTELPENKIIAKYNGKVSSEKLIIDGDNTYVQYSIEYDTTDPTEKYVTIQGSNTIPIGKPSITGFKMNYRVGDTFVLGDVLATKRVEDKGNLLICGDLDKVLYFNNYYVPFSIQDYDSELNAYIMEAYLGTDDMLDSDEKININMGIYNKESIQVPNLAINMNNQFLEMNVLYNNIGNNRPHKYSTFTGLNGFTLTNTYVTSETDKFDFISSLKYIRSTNLLLPGGTEPEDFKIKILEVPLVGASWCYNVDNYDYFITQFALINFSFDVAAGILENNFSIDSKLYNTYGKSRFYHVGNNEDSLVLLNSVRCKFKFGLRLNIVASTDIFIDTFRSYVRSYVENTNDLTSSGRDIYIMNMISDIKNNFTEIIYIEYYGMNIYDYRAQKIVGPDLDDYWESFIPEFINLDTLLDENGEPYPNIEVDILSS